MSQSRLAKCDFPLSTLPNQFQVLYIWALWIVLYSKTCCIFWGFYRARSMLQSGHRGSRVLPQKYFPTIFRQPFQPTNLETKISPTQAMPQRQQPTSPYCSSCTFALACLLLRKPIPICPNALGQHFAATKGLPCAMQVYDNQLSNTFLHTQPWTSETHRRRHHLHTNILTTLNRHR